MLSPLSFYLVMQPPVSGAAASMALFLFSRARISAEHFLISQDAISRKRKKGHTKRYTRGGVPLRVTFFTLWHYYNNFRIFVN